MTSSTFTQVAAAAVSFFALAIPAQAALVYSLANDGQSLIRFDTATPGAVTTVGNINLSGVSIFLSGLDFRPSNGLLYGYQKGQAVPDRVYTVDTSSGAVTLVNNLSTGSSTFFMGIDFNPVADRLRIVNVSGDNLRANVDTGATLADVPLAYAFGDPSAGPFAPRIIDAAYTNSTSGVVVSTTLYYLDHDENVLVSTSNPNAGVLNTVGALGFDIEANTGFDIFSDGGNNTAFATFRVGFANGLYGINLATGAATLLGAVGETSRMFGLAIVPGNPVVAAAVPEPGSLALVGAAGLAAAYARRRRNLGVAAHTA